MAKRTVIRRETRKEGTPPERRVLYGLGVGAVIGAIYFASEYFRDLKHRRETDAESIAPEIIMLPASSGSSTTGSGNDHFPLKKGSKGTKVVLLQQGLERILGKTVLAQFTKIDGDFGPKTEQALAKAGFPAVINEALFRQITGASETSSAVINNPQTIARSLYTAAIARNSDSVLAHLKQIKSSTEYALVNKYFIDLQSLSVSRSIVSYLLTVAFSTNETVKDQIRAEFRRMGLKQDASGTWSLSGIKKYRDVKTITDTYVTDQANRKISVSRNTILGEEISAGNGMTRFRSIDNAVFSVPTSDVKYV